MFDRGMYAGPVGWFGGVESEFAVGIRSALIGQVRNIALLFSLDNVYLLIVAIFITILYILYCTMHNTGEQHTSLCRCWYC